MRSFPITCVDDFYPNVNEVREFALSFKYSKSIKGNYPGERSESIYKVDRKFANDFAYKLFSLFFDYRFTNVRWSFSTFFHKIYYDEGFTEGFIHRDDISTTLLAGVIYLTPNAVVNSGTSLYKPKNSKKDPYTFKDNLIQLRNDCYINGNCTSFIPLLEEHNLQFEKTLEFKNLYNRMICYDPSIDHSFSNPQSQPDNFRLTQVFFIHDVSINYEI
tara:strand:+ start:169 stop:819 length:651 start_codon:yes stop_codon:yes gene_type:complete